jgi:hypothetical protein
VVLEYFKRGDGAWLWLPIPDFKKLLKYFGKSAIIHCGEVNSELAGIDRRLGIWYSRLENWKLRASGVPLVADTHPLAGGEPAGK